MRVSLVVMVAALLACGCDKDDGTAGWTIATSTNDDGTTGADTSGTTDAGSSGITDTGPSTVADSGAATDLGDGDSTDAASDGLGGDATQDGAGVDGTTTDGSLADADSPVDGHADDGSGHEGDTGHTPDVLVDDAAATCTPTVTFLASTTASHVTEPPTYSSYPPSSGDHYATPSAWGVAKGFVPAAYWVHNLEHGGVVFLYKCDAPCPALAAELHAIVDSLPSDAACDGIPGVDNRVILTEDPCLPDGVSVAAVAWEWTYEATCVDAASLKQFVADHQGLAPEDSCGQGSFVATAADPAPTCPTIEP